MKGVYTACCEVSVAFYCETFREAFWPNDIPCPKAPIRTETEKDLLSKSALAAITNIATGF